MNKLLSEMGIEFEKVNYYLEPLTELKLKGLLKKMALGARDILRTSEAIYRELGIAKSDMKDDELIKLMVKYPDLIQRPIVEMGARAVLGRPVENVKTLL
jgi:arsenate reductase